MKRRWFELAALFAVGGPVGVASVEAFRAWRLAHDDFKRWPVPFEPPAALEEAEAITLRTRDGLKIAASFVPSKNGAAVIVAHGAKASRVQLWPDIVALAKAGFGVLAFDWPGFGESEGDVTFGEPEHQTFGAAVDFLSQRPEVQTLAAYGFSNGAALLTRFAAFEPRVKALVAVASFTDALEQTRYEHRAWGLLRQWPAVYATQKLLKGNLRPLDDAPKLRGRPTLFVSGSVDAVVPSWMSGDLAAAAGGEYRLIVGAGHSDFRDHAEPAWSDQLIAFFTTATQL